MVKRCPWATKSPELLVYHDTIWGRPQHDPQELFKALCLEIMQAGLTFSTVLKFEEGMDTVFHDFSPDYLAKCDESDVERFCNDKRIIRNHSKVEAIIQNAKPEDFTFKGFYNAGMYGFRNYVPVYGIGGMEYYVNLGKIQVIG